MEKFQKQRLVENRYILPSVYVPQENCQDQKVREEVVCILQKRFQTFELLFPPLLLHSEKVFHFPEQWFLQIHQNDVLFLLQFPLISLTFRMKITPSSLVLLERHFPIFQKLLCARIKEEIELLFVYMD